MGANGTNVKNDHKTSPTFGSLVVEEHKTHKHSNFYPLLFVHFIINRNNYVLMKNKKGVGEIVLVKYTARQQDKPKHSRDKS